MDRASIQKLRRVRDDLSISLRSPIEIVREAANLLTGETSDEALFIRGLDSELDDVPLEGTPSLWDPDAYQKRRSEGEQYIIRSKQRVLDCLDSIIKELDPQPELSKCIDQWVEFVQEVRAGYGRYVEEYDNDLSIRTIIERLLPIRSTGADLSERLAKADRDFAELTYEDEKLARRTGGWWTRRLPLSPSGHLKEDLLQP